MKIIDMNPFDKYSNKPLEIIGKKYGDKIIILAKLTIISKADLHQVWCSLYGSNGKLISTLPKLYFTKEDAIDYCKQSKLPYSYE